MDKRRRLLLERRKMTNKEKAKVLKALKEAYEQGLMDAEGEVILKLGMDDKISDTELIVDYKKRMKEFERTLITYDFSC